MDELLRRQWDALMVWLDRVDATAYADVPSGLGDWTVGDLIAHLGLGLGLAAGVGVPSPSVPVVSIGEYVAAYPRAATEIAAMTQDVRASLGPDLLGGLHQIGERVWRAIAAYDRGRVLARRGAMHTSDYLTTRLIELVVHGDDLSRALQQSGTTPVIPEALIAVSRALAAAYHEKTGTAPAPLDDLAWVRIACGRVASNDVALPLL